MTETLEFRTDVLTSHNGTEDRTASRAIARHQLRYDVQAGLFDRQSIFNLADQNVRGKWSVPMWSDAVAVDNLTGASVTCDPLLSDFRAGQLVFAMRTIDEWQVREIATVTPTGFTVTAPFDSMQSAYIMPVNTARMRGDMGYKLASFDSAFTTIYNVENPRAYPTKLAVLFAMDRSGSMGDPSVSGGTKLDAMRSNLLEVLYALRGTVVNSGVKVDFKLCLWSSFVANYTYLDATESDFDEAIAIVTAMVSSGATNPLLAFQSAMDFFTVESVNPGERKDIMFYVTDAAENTTSSAALAYDLIHRVAPYDGNKSVDIYAVNIETTVTSQALKVDNASGAIANVSAENPDALLEQFERAIVPQVGYQYGGHEILSQEPVTEKSATKSVFMQEDILDFGIAPYVSRTPWEQSRLTSVHSFLFEAGRESYDMRRFIYRRQGAARAFRMPTFQHDLPITELVNGRTQAFVDANDFDAFNGDRRVVGVKFTNGTWQGNIITLVEGTVDGRIKLTFAKPMRKELAQINQISYMGLARFNTDRIELQWIGNRAISMSINMMEIQK